MMNTLKDVAEWLDQQANLSPHYLSNSQRSIWHMFFAMLAKALRKNHDYGDSVFSPPMLVPHMSVLDAILVRMGDKAKRIVTLRSVPKTLVRDESLVDTLSDLGVYSLFAAIELDPRYPEPIRPDTPEQEAKKCVYPTYTYVLEMRRDSYSISSRFDVPRRDDALIIAFAIATRRARKYRDARTRFVLKGPDGEETDITAYLKYGKYLKEDYGLW